MAGPARGDSDEPISEINIVPFVDIILVLLIVFMITAPMVVKPSLNLDLPEAKTAGETKPSALTVVIDREGKLVINGEVSDEDGLLSVAKALVQREAAPQAIISADKAVPHGRVIVIIDLLRGAGIDRFAMSADKTK